MLKNFWYVAELSSAITYKPKKITLLDRDFVLYRNSKNQVVALSNLCPHRGSSLADGWVEGDCIRCPYHGWKYQSDGICVDIPTNPPGTNIPKHVYVDAYPVEEKYGWVWLFLGDIPTVERPPFPPFPEFGASGWRTVYGEFKWNAPYTLVMENNLDISHPAFVHADSFGRQFDPQNLNDRIDLHDWSGCVSLQIPAQPQRGIWQYVLGHKNRPNILAQICFYMPNVTRLDVDYGIFKFINFNVHVPIDKQTTVTKWIQLRNFLTHPLFDSDARRRNLRIFRQDRRIVEAQYPNLLSSPLKVRADKLPMAYRWRYQKCLEKGWGIEQDWLRSHDSSVQKVVIPSPIRQQLLEITSPSWGQKKNISQRRLSHEFCSKNTLRSNSRKDSAAFESTRNPE